MSSDLETKKIESEVGEIRTFGKTQQSTFALLFFCTQVSGRGKCAISTGSHFLPIGFLWPGEVAYFWLSGLQNKPKVGSWSFFLAL